MRKKPTLGFTSLSCPDTVASSHSNKSRGTLSTNTPLTLASPETTALSHWRGNSNRNQWKVVNTVTTNKVHLEPMFDPKKYYSLDQSAEAYQVHRDTLRRAIARGELHATKIGGQFRIPGWALNEFAKPYSGQVAA